MRYLVEATLTPERGKQVEAAGGPGPAIGHLMERFHPEAAYVGLTRRVALLVADLQRPEDMAKLTVYLTNFAGQNPIYTAVLPINSAAAALGAAISNVASAPSV